jgi:hypothetical protein
LVRIARTEHSLARQTGETFFFSDATVRAAIRRFNDADDPNIEVSK